MLGTLGLRPRNLPSNLFPFATLIRQKCADNQWKMEDEKVEDSLSPWGLAGRRYCPASSLANRTAGSAWALQQQQQHCVSEEAPTESSK